MSEPIRWIEEEEDAPVIASPSKSTNDKKNKGQFYTVNHNYILEGLDGPPADALRVVEPFAGQGDLLTWLDTKPNRHLPIEAYDIEPKSERVEQRDTLSNPPDYSNAWIITNPPYLARNKCEYKAIFDKYDTNDLYKCFLTSLTNQAPCRGGIIIIPAGFFFSPRDIDVRCRSAFMKQYRLLRIKYFEETVFPDTSTTVIAIQFERSDAVLTEQLVEWIMCPSGEKKQFLMQSDHDWIIGGDIYHLSLVNGVKVRRYVEGQALRKDEYITHMTLNALDSGTKSGRIALEYKEGYVYPAKECSRTYATLCIQGKTLTNEQQRQLCDAFNELVEQKRSDTWSLFLPQFRESKEYARKRIPFELAYTIVLHVLQRF